MNKHPALLKKIPLVEKFGPTIQGEGATIGLQTFFLRFGLCDYNCTMCDSIHAVDPVQVKNKAMWLTQKDIAEMFSDENILKSPHPTKWITFSGGNPCIHDLQHLVDALKTWDYKIAVETQGTMWQEWLRDCDIVTVSPKSPGMGEMFEPDKYSKFIDSFGFSDCAVNTKVVIFDQKDIEFAERVAKIWVEHKYPMSDFYLSQGNAFPPDRGQKIGMDLHVSMLREQYLKLFDLINRSEILCEAKWLPQFHVWLWSNKQGV